MGGSRAPHFSKSDMKIYAGQRPANPEKPLFSLKKNCSKYHAPPKSFVQNFMPPPKSFVQNLDAPPSFCPPPP